MLVCVSVLSMGVYHEWGQNDVCVLYISVYVSIQTVYVCVRGNKVNISYLFGAALFHQRLVHSIIHGLCARRELVHLFMSQAWDKE